MKLHIVHIYPDEMNTYGDRGNLLVLQKRAIWHGLEPVIHYYHVGAPFPKEVDLILGGGGQDSAQSDIQRDILKIGDTLHALTNTGTPMLMVCGTYQLFGRRFVTAAGDEIQGIGIFNVETFGGPKRLIGNATVKTTGFGTLYGFENHSGKTRLGPGQQPLGTITRGSGNNGKDKTEGARTNNTMGTYLHGPLLPNNPAFADALLTLALEHKGISPILTPIDDSLAIRFREDAAKRLY